MNVHRPTASAPDQPAGGPQAARAQTRVRVSYISWAPHCSRSDFTARELGGTSHMVYCGWLGSHPATILPKYAAQSVSTWRVLNRERPDVVFVMSPPPIAILAVYIYCLVRGGRFVVDAHSGVFLTKRWRWFQRMQFWLCRRAATTIVTNDVLAALVNARGGRTTVVPDVPIVFEGGPDDPSGFEEFTVVCVTSFDRDEPIAAMVGAAVRLPGVKFLMTGDVEGKRQLLPSPLPANLQLTGFLDPAEYGRLLRRASVVIALTTDEHTMQRGAYEAIYQGTPVIVSDTPLLRAAFDEGALHVRNTPDEIARAVLDVRSNRIPFKQGAGRLQLRKRARWLETRAALLEVLAAG
jgi:glycosyltransferase involved in cell wall biosynthesis